MDFAAPPSVTNLTIWEMGWSRSLSLSLSLSLLQMEIKLDRLSALFHRMLGCRAPNCVDVVRLIQGLGLSAPAVALALVPVAVHSFSRRCNPSGQRKGSLRTDSAHNWHHDAAEHENQISEMDFQVSPRSPSNSIHTLNRHIASAGPSLYLWNQEVEVRWSQAYLSQRQLACRNF